MRQTKITDFIEMECNFHADKEKLLAIDSKQSVDLGQTKRGVANYISTKK